MIFVDVYVPALEKTYDFKMDERLTAAETAEALSDMICQKEQCQVQGDEQRLTLWDRRTGQRLLPDEILYRAGIHSGSTLLLV